MQRLILFLSSTLLTSMGTPAQTTTGDKEILSEAQLDSIEKAVYGNARDLQEIVITADAPMIRVEGNQISYNVAEDPTAAGESVLDLLRKVPLVSVDGQDNITLKGESDFKIYVNGRPDPSLSANASTILKAMPAAAVSKVEVIPDPGAKFDAEGSGGIINLVIGTQQRRQSGYNGSLTASVTNRDVNAGAFGAAKIGKVTLNANVNYMNQDWFKQSGATESLTEYIDDPINRFLTSSSVSPRKFHYFGANISSSWEPTEEDLFNFSVNYTDVAGNIGMYDDRNEMRDPAKALIWGYTRQADIGIGFRSASANAAWQHSFGRQDNYLALSYQFDYGWASNSIEETFGDLVNYSLPYLAQTNINNTYNRTHTIQLDYSNVLSPHATIETGAKGIFRRNSAFSHGEGSNDLVLYSPLPASYTNIGQPQDIYALYALYRATYGSMSAEAGVRYEHTRMGIRYHYGTLSDFTSRLNDVVPNAGITYSFSPAHALALNYSMRISRPALEQINPYCIDYSIFQSQQGNPDLTSERINKVSLSYRNFGRLIGMSVSLDYTHSGNAITSVVYLDGPRQISTFANIGRKENAAINAFILFNGIRNVRLTLNGMAGYSYLKAENDVTSHGWDGNLNLNAQWTLPYDINLSANGGYFWGRIGLQTKSSDFYYYGLGISKDFLTDKSLRLTLNANNFAQRNQSFTTTTTTPEFISRMSATIPAWRIGLSATWTFGNTPSQIRNVNTSIVNDDLSTSSGNSITSSGNPR